MILGLAPMDGFTDCAMRQITQNIFDKYGNKSDFDLLLWTEFMTADGYDRNPGGVIKHLLTTKDQKELIAQIFGGKPETLVKTAVNIQNKYGKYFKGIELNIGCPANNVMRSGGGSALLNDKKNTLKIIKDIKSNLDMPFSIKTRTGLNFEDKNNQTEFILEASKYCSMITIHGRTLKGGYHELPDRKFIYNIKKLADKNCKIIGNGGIKSYQEIQSHCEHSEAILDGLMIGQSAIGNPRIFTPHTPDKQELKETIIQHLNLMISYELQFQEIINKKTINILIPNSKFQIPNSQFQIPSKPIIEFRKHLFNYVKGIPGSKEFKQKIATIKDYQNLVNEINKFLK
ncbi:tRNA-dihydrouridine synthase family protein [Candidatus Gracilibacteria bacterium]|nr:tRNA-dihydrouridine synthase family protein [Candidatus Gracilibacteria bacterium]